MSFIYDNPSLIEQLVKSGLDFESKFTKQGQAAPPVAPTAPAENQNFSNINTLINNLQTKMAPPAPAEDPNASKDPNAAPDISYQDAGKPGAKDPPLTSANLEGLGALVAWAANNGITVDGKRIAYNLNDDPKDENYQLYRLEPNAGLLEVGDRSMVKQGYYANKDLLKKFIQWRQSILAQKPNMVEKVQLNKLIADANKLLGANISPEYKAPEASLPLNKKIDDVPNIIDEKNYNAPGNIPLTFGDIQADTSLNAWLEKNRISIKDVQPADFDRCVVVRFLVMRARAKVAGATSPELKNMYTIYVRQMEKIGPTITGKDGKPCKISGVSPGATPGQGATVNPQVLAQAISTLPFNVRDINFNRIKSFFAAIAPVMSQNEAAQTHMTNVEDTLMPQAFSFLSVKDGIIPLGERVHQFASRLSNQQEPGKQVFPLISVLDRILDETRAVVEAFWYAHRDKFNSGQQAQILGQIGRNPDDSSIYSRNADALETLRTSGTVT